MKNISIALIHYPVYNKKKEIVASSITNFDIHDIARCARTYGVKKYFIIHPQKSQRDFASELISFWQDGYGKEYNSDRSSAVDIVEVVADLKEIEEKYGKHKLIATTAQDRPNGIDIDSLAREAVSNPDLNYLLLFGTGWGMSEEIFQIADNTLKPVLGAGEYNHLSVRSAAAIILDRVKNSMVLYQVL